MLGDYGKVFICWLSIANCFIDNLNGTRKRNRKNCVCGNGGGFFGCFVSYIITWNGRMARDPLNEDGRYGVDGIVS